MDIVYFCKDAKTNEELTYSIRSVVANFPHDKIWIYGGCPENIKTDNYVHITQVGPTKWDKVRKMYQAAVNNPGISDDFFLFNDDFFIMQPLEFMPVLYRATLPEHILEIEMKHGDRPSEYTKLLRTTYRNLLPYTEDVLSYELHIPFLFNKARLKKIMDKFPSIHATRTLYGNYFKIGGDRMSDVKVYGTAPRNNVNTSTFLSTDDSAWKNDKYSVATRVRNSFPQKSDYEI